MGLYHPIILLAGRTLTFLDVCSHGSKAPCSYTPGVHWPVPSEQLPSNRNSVCEKVLIFAQPWHGRGLWVTLARLRLALPPHV